MKNLIARFVREDEGQDLVEYALLIAFVALACIIGLQQLGTAINQTYQEHLDQPQERQLELSNTIGSAGAHVAGRPVD